MRRDSLLAILLLCAVMVASGISMRCGAVPQAADAGVRR